MNRVILGFIILFFLSCGHSKKDLVVVDFREIKGCNKNGISRDSSVSYFPTELFHDTVRGFYDGNSITRFCHMSKKEYANISDRKIENLKDTFEIVTEDSIFTKANSYMLYKMTEPVLCSHYLNKEIYRMTSIRTLSKPPLVVTIEKYKDSVVLITKRLNRHISYPFVVMATNCIVFPTPDFSTYDRKTNKYIITNKKKYNQILAKSKNRNDSLARIYNNCDYHLVLNNRMKISRVAWDSLKIMIDSAKFWKSKPELALGYEQIDGSRWTLEGHSENGYQIRVVPSPHFNSNRYPNYFDSKNNYAKIFKYIMRLTNMKDEYLY